MLIELDGSYGEGGGQILRSAVALSALTGKGMEIFNIRSKRDKPGLAAQHLAGVRGVASLCSAEVEGAQIGATWLMFRPGRNRGGRHRLDVGTAGSVTLVLQACLLASLRAEEDAILEITGGTNVPLSPPIDYYNFVLLPLLRRMGVRVDMHLVQRGFYPQGGGEVKADISPCPLIRPMDLRERGELEELGGVCFTQNLPEHVCERMTHSVRKAFLGKEMRIRSERTSGVSTGAGISLYSRFKNTVLGADALGERGVPSERVGQTAADALRAEIQGPGTLDVHAADQLVAYMAMAEGPSHFKVREISEHLRTQMWLLQRFMEVRFEIEALESGAEVTVLPSRTSPGR